MEGLVRFQSSNQVTVGTIEGATVLDGMNVTDFGDDVIEYIKDKPGLHLLLNFNNITYMSSAGLTELLRIHHALGESKGSIRLCNLSGEIHKVFKITNLDQLFNAQGSEDVESAMRRYERSLAVAADEDAWASQDAGT